MCTKKCVARKQPRFLFERGKVTDCFYENTHLPVSAYQFGLSRVVRFQRHCFFPFFSNAAAAPIFTGIAREKGKAQGHTLEMKFKKKKSCRFLKNPFKIRYIQLHANSCWANCLLTGVSGVMLNWLWLEKCLNLISNYFSGSHFFKIVFKIDHWFFDCLSIYQSYKTYTKRHVTKRNEKRNTIFTNNHHDSTNNEKIEVCFPRIRRQMWLEELKDHFTLSVHFLRCEVTSMESTKEEEKRGQEILTPATNTRFNRRLVARH